VTEVSFNRVTVDGDMSTNDSVFLLANGASGASLKTRRDEALFESALQELSIDLAKKIAKDGEGASKFLEIRVEGARTAQAAQRMAEVVATSPLVKTAAYGEDSNWGRILAALGRAGVPFDPSRVDICFGSLCVFKAGSPTSVSAEAARVPLTCDFTGQYVDINARYRT
jgi:glutamate N-acetyltransferase/amino-acid N-acetyltransferase